MGCAFRTKRLLRCSLLAFALGACGSTAASTETTTASDTTAASDDRRARCEQFVTRATELGYGEAESTFEQKVDYCLEQNLSDAFLDCVIGAQTREEADTCE
jgi:hypothetical protein